MKRLMKRVVFWSCLAGVVLLISVDEIADAIYGIKDVGAMQQERVVLGPGHQSQIQLSEVIIALGFVLLLSSAILAVVVMVMNRRERQEV